MKIYTNQFLLLLSFTCRILKTPNLSWSEIIDQILYLNLTSPRLQLVFILLCVNGARESAVKSLKARFSEI